MTDATAMARAPQSMRALAWMGGALFSFVLLALAGREASRHATTLEMMFYRSVISLLIILVVAWVLGARPADLYTKRLPLHGVRAATHFVGQFSWLYAIALIPLAQLFAIEFTAPIWVALLAPMFLKERLTPTRLVAAMIGFIGTLVVIRPGALTVGEGTLFALLAAIGFALSMVCTKELTKTETPLRILFYMFALQTLLSLLLVFWGLRLLNPAAMTWVTALAVFGLTAHYSLVRAFSLADAIIVAPMDFLRLPLIAIVGVLIYSEPLDPWILFGGAVVVLGNLINLWGERRPSPLPADTSRRSRD